MPILANLVLLFAALNLGVKSIGKVFMQIEKSLSIIYHLIELALKLLDLVIFVIRIESTQKKNYRVTTSFEKNPNFNTALTSCANNSHSHHFFFEEGLGLHLNYSLSFLGLAAEPGAIILTHFYLEN